MIAIELDNISLSISNKTIFKNAHLKIPKGKITGIIGKNGAGKTTLFDLFCGIRTPDRGKLTTYAKQFSYLSQTLGMPSNLSMKEIYEMTAALSCEHAPSIAEAIAQFRTWDSRLTENFSKTLEKRPNQCSYGEIRFFFTLALISFSKQLLILDEPTAGVDPESRHHIWSFLRKARESGTTIVISSHNIEEICANCDSFYLIHKHQFSKFESAESFISFFKSQTLEEAFIASTYDQS